MKKPIFNIAFFLLLSFSLVSGQSKKLRIIAESADIHIEPYLSSMVIETVKKGAVLTLFDTGRKQKSWLYVSFYVQDKWVTITGFVEAKLVEEIGEKGQTGQEEKPDVPARKIPVKQKVPPKRPKDVKPKTGEQEKKIEKEQVFKKEPALLPFSGRLQITSEEAVMRADANANAKILREIRLDEKVDALGKKGDWFRIKYPQEDGIVLTGFVFKDHVDMISGELAEKATEEIPTEKIEKEPAKPVKQPEEKKRAEAVEEIERRPEPERVAQPEYLEKKPEFSNFNLGLGIDVGYAMPGDSLYSGALHYGAHVSYRLHRFLAVELSGFRFQSDVKGDIEALSTGKLSMIPIILSIQGRYPLDARFVPYVSLGGGFYFNKFTLDTGISQSWDNLGFDVSEKIKNCLGFHVGGGLDYYLTEDIAVRVNVRYLLASTEGEWNQTDQISGVETSGEIKDLNLNSLVLGVGIKLRFRIF